MIEYLLISPYSSITFCAILLKFYCLLCEVSGLTIPFINEKYNFISLFFKNMFFLEFHFVWHCSLLTIPQLLLKYKILDSKYFFQNFDKTLHCFLTLGIANKKSATNLIFFK